MSRETFPGLPASFSPIAVLTIDPRAVATVYRSADAPFRPWAVRLVWSGDPGWASVARYPTVEGAIEAVCTYGVCAGRTSAGGRGIFRSAGSPPIVAEALPDAPPSLIAALCAWADRGEIRISSADDEGYPEHRGRVVDYGGDNEWSEGEPEFMGVGRTGDAPRTDRGPR